MVKGDDERNLLFQLGDAVPETLVVVHQVELGQSLGQMGVGAGAEGCGFGKATRHELRGFQPVIAGLELPVRRDAAWIVVVEQVEAGKFRQRNALVENWVWLPGEHLHVVTEVDERLGEVTGVHPLAAHVGLAAVGEVRERDGLIGVPSGGAAVVASHRSRLTGHCYRSVNGSKRASRFARSAFSRCDGCRFSSWWR